MAAIDPTTIESRYVLVIQKPFQAIVLKPLKSWSAVTEAFAKYFGPDPMDGTHPPPAFTTIIDLQRYQESPLAEILPDYEPLARIDNGRVSGGVMNACYTTIGLVLARKDEDHGETVSS